MPEIVSRKLCAILYQMDDEGVETLFGQLLPAEGIGLTIINRLSRATGFHMMEADG